MKSLSAFVATLFLFACTGNAQFAGYYNLHDGGVDMSSSSLFVMSNGEFALFYDGGLKSGTWRETSKDQISLKEAKTLNRPFLMFGKPGGDAKVVSIDVYGLCNADASVNFSKNGVAGKELQPLFNHGANCIGNGYILKKEVGVYTALTLTIPTDPDYNEKRATYPYTALSYTFPLPKEYRSYEVMYNPDALREPLKLTLTRKGESYFMGDEKALQREELTPEMLQKIEKGKRAFATEIVPARAGEPILSSAPVEITIEKSTLKPLFIARCEGDKEDEEAAQKEEKPLPAVNRKNGFYSVTNYTEKNNDPAHYILAKEPALTKADIESVTKKISEYSGFEMAIVFTPAGALKFKSLSRANINKPIAIVINKTLVSAPIVQAAIAGGKVNIAGGFSEQQIEDLIAKLKE